uniref:NACHT domain-containing protein n=1 Tax=Anabas testudineus TaxID=64144 RepID=A0A7N6BF18_ANATE
MDEELDPDDENVNSVLAQESSELLRILTSQPLTVIMQLCQMMPGDARWHVDSVATSTSSAAVTEHVKAVLEYFRATNATDCRTFLQSICMLCENIPMHLESRLMSVAGYEHTDAIQSAAKEPVSLRITDHWQQYTVAVTCLQQKRWERLSEHLVSEVHLENVWISLRMSNRSRDRPDQTPGFADRGSRTPEPDGDFGSLESRVTLETFLQGCTGKVTVVAGQAGSGKTLLMSRLGQQWARGLGPIPSSYLFIVLEFRQLNLLSRPLSLSELLFRHYLPPKGGDDEKRAIMDYLLSNPEQSCWVLDGYDEFLNKLTKQDMKHMLDPESPLPVAEIISGLLHRQLLPGCTVLVTCRLRDIMDLEDISDKVGQLLAWGCHEVKEYVDNFFRVKGKSLHLALGVQATHLLLSNRHLLVMSSLPALCYICCICLKHLLLETKEDGTRVQSGDREEERGNLSRKKAKGNEPKVEQTAGGTNGRAQHPPTVAQIPLTLTQVYITVLGAFLSPDFSYFIILCKYMLFSVSYCTIVCRLDFLTQYRSELCELAELAWRGLEESKILFMKEDISQDVLELSVKTGLFSQVELTREDGLVTAYCFIHLTIHEFLAALRIMTSTDVSDTELKKRFSLKTRWTTKSDQKTVFTDSLHLYLCGLASTHCTQALVHLARASCGTGAQSWVQKRQAFVLKLLKKKCNSNILTGPKILELCHCVQESQDNQLAKEVAGVRPTLELRNIPLSPSDIDALAFVVNSVGDNGIGLDFGACSMELECLDVLSKCRHIHYLSFRSRKYGDKLAEKLSLILPKFTTLRKLEFCGTSLTATGAASLASALQTCPNITEINLSDNNLKDEGIRYIADIFAKLPRLTSVVLGRNNSSLQAVDYLVGKISSGLNIQHFHAEYDTRTRTHKTKSEPTISLLNQKWSTPEMQQLANSLACCPALSVLDLSGGQWDVEVLKTLTQFLPKFNICKKIILNGSCSSVKGLVVLTALLSNCPAVVELHIRLLSSKAPNQVSIVFSGAREKPAVKVSKILCLSCCGLVPADLDRVWKSLGTSCDLTVLDLSQNCLGNKGLKKLVGVLPRLYNIQEIDASNNGISMEGVFTLAEALCSHNNLTQIHIRDGGKEQVILKFCSDIRLNSSSLMPSDIDLLCLRLAQCHPSLELDLSHSSLKDQTIKCLLKVLPKMRSLQKLNVSHSITSTMEALTLLTCFTVNQRVTSVKLRLTHFHLNSDNLERLLEILQPGPTISYLDLSSNQLEDKEVERLVDSLTSLKITSCLNLSNNSLTQQGLLAVAGTVSTYDNVSAVEVSIEEGWIRAEEAVRLVRCCLKLNNNIQTIRVHHTTLHLSLLKSTEMTSVSPVDQLAPMISTIQMHPLLTELDFSNSLGKEGAEFLCSLLPSLPNLTSLSIGSKETCTDALEKLAEVLLQSTTLINNNIRLLFSSLSHCECSATGRLQLVQALGQCVSLEHLWLNKIRTAMGTSEVNDVLDLLAAMEGLTQMEEIELDGWRMPVTGVEQLTRLLPVWKELRKISLSKNLIVDQSGDKLLEALISCCHLEELHLSRNQLGDLTAARMACVLPSLAHLAVLDISENRIGCEGSVSLSKAVMCLRYLTKINLTSVGTSELCAVAASLTNCPLIQDVSFGWNNCGDEVALELAKVLPLCQKLTRIDLESNSVSVVGAEALVKALQSCPALQLIRLWRNKISTFEAQRLTDMDRRLNFSST